MREMVNVRHSAEQRGNFEPLGRLQWLNTEHGMIRFPAVNGEGCGPDLACVMMPTCVDWNTLCVLGLWEGLPPLRVNTTKPCPKCRHACDVCDGSGKKLCELCGGRSWIPGPWLPCPGPGCSKDTGNFKGDCVTCHGSGQVPEQVKCKGCEGSTLQTCSRCIGTGKYSTGRVNGSVDWDIAPQCKACSGSTNVGEWRRQDEKRFVNAHLCYGPELSNPRRQRPTALKNPRNYLVLGPIREFAIQDPRTSRTRIFDVGADAAGDLLVLLAPSRPTMKPQKAYLVGGVVREREVRTAVSA